jgi:hypothetical protein
MRNLIMLAATTLIFGCAVVEPTYVYVDSVASGSAADLKKYYLLAEPRPYYGVIDSGNDTAYGRRRHQKFVVQTDQILQAQGFEKVDSPEQAELIVVLEYGVEVMRVGAHTERTSTVQINAFDWEAVRDTDRRNALWRTHAYMDGSSGGLSRVIPTLLEAAQPYVGTSTDGVAEVLVE